MANLNTLMPQSPSRRGWECEAASKLATLMQREFGLSPAGAEAALRGGVLSVCLMSPLSPLGRVLLQTPEGVKALETVYALLHIAHGAQMEALMTRIAGAPACRSRLTLDCESGDVWVRFEMDTPAKKERR